MGSLHQLKLNQPPSARFTIGRDHHGWWVVHDKFDHVGGLFTSEDAALHFAREAADNDAAMICRAKEGTELELFEQNNISIGRQILANNRRLGLR